MYASTSFKALFAVAVAAAVLLGLAVGGFAPADALLHVKPAAGVGGLPANHTVYVQVPVNHTVYVNRTVYLNRTVYVPVPTTTTAVEAVNRTIYVNNTVPVFINRTIVVNRTVPVYLQEAPPPPNATSLLGMNWTEALQFVKLVYVNSTGPNLLCEGTLAVGPNGTGYFAGVILLPYSEAEPYLTRSHYLSSFGHGLGEFTFNIGTDALFAAYDSQAPILGGGLFVFNTTLPGTDLTPALMGTIGGVGAIGSIGNYWINWIASHTNATNGSFIIGTWSTGYGGSEFRPVTPCLIQVQYFSSWSQLYNATYLGAQYWATVEAMARNGTANPCAVPFEWTIGWWGARTVLPHGTAYVPHGPNWNYICRSQQS